MRKIFTVLLSVLLLSSLLMSSSYAAITPSGNDLLQDAVSKIKLRFAMYAQDRAWLQNFWINVDMDKVDADLKEMKRKGFNAVAIEVNVGDIFSSMNTGNNTYVQDTVKQGRFQTFIQKAKAQGLYTIVWTNIASIPSGWGGSGVAGAQRAAYKDLLGFSYPAYYGYVAPGLQAAAYGNDPALSTFRWTVVKDFHTKLVQLSGNDPTVIWDPLDWQYLNTNYWDNGTSEILADWRAYLKLTNTSANYWLGRWGETQTVSWNNVLLPIDQTFIDSYLNSPQVLPGDPILVYTGVPATTNTNKWSDYKVYSDSGLNKMIADLTGVIKTADPNAVIVQRIDYWRYGGYRVSTWGTSQVDFIAHSIYPFSDTAITNVYTDFNNEINYIRNQLTPLGRNKPIMAWEMGVDYNYVYGLTQSKIYKENKQQFVVNEDYRLVKDANLAGMGYWTFRDMPVDQAQLSALNTMTGRSKPGQKAMTAIISKVNENSSFEDDATSNTWPDLWETQWRNGTSLNPSASRQPFSPIDGSYVYRLYNGTGDPASIQFAISDNIPVVAVAPYQINASMRYTLSSGGTAYMTVIQYDKLNNALVQTDKTYNNGGWVWNDNYISFTTHANASYIRVRFGVGGEAGTNLDLDRVRFMSTGLHLGFDDATYTGEDGETPTNSASTSFDNGIIGKSVVVNGASAQLSYSTAGNFDPGTGSLETWIQPYWDYDSAGTSGNKTIFYWSVDANNSFRLAIDGQKTLKAEWKSAGVTKTASYVITGWKSNLWHHIATTWNPSDGTIKLYTDGTLQQSTTAWTTPVGTSNSIHLGHKASVEQFNGRLDEVHIYDYVRNANQVVSDSRAKPTLWLNFVSDRDGYDTEAPTTATNVPLTTDRFGTANSAVAFSSTSVLSYPATGNFHVPAGSVEAWVKSNLAYSATPTGPDQYIFNWAQQEWINELKLYIWQRNLLSLKWYVGSTLYYVNYTISGWTAGSWHHVAATWNKENQTLKLYVDGALVGTATQTTFVTGWVDKIDIGSFNSAYDRWDGTIDDITVYAYDRSVAEILTAYRGY